MWAGRRRRPTCFAPRSAATPTATPTRGSWPAPRPGWSRSAGPRHVPLRRCGAADRGRLHPDRQPAGAAGRLQRRDQLPSARDSIVHPRRRDHECVGHLAPADCVRLVPLRLDPGRARSRVDRSVAVLRGDLGLGGRRRRRARLDPDTRHEGEGLPGAARRCGHGPDGAPPHDWRGRRNAIRPAWRRRTDRR